MATAVTTSTASASYKAYQILHLAFTIAPLVAGADKFFDKLTDWDKYLAPVVSKIIPAHTFMMAVGGIEIVAGLLVLWKPRIGAFVVSAWLLGIVLNLLLIPGYFDVALRDFGLALGALALGFLALDYDRGSESRPTGHTSAQTS